MNDAAETNNTEKRQKTKSPKTSNESLIEQAMNPLRNTLAPLPSSLTTAAIPHAQENLKLYIAHQQELKKIEKYSDADYMPKSLKHNFTMTSTNRLERTRNFLPTSNEAKTHWKQQERFTLLTQKAPSKD